MSAPAQAGELTATFQTASAPKRPNRRKKYPPPFSIRLSPEELAALKRRAGSTPVSTYARELLLASDEKRPRQQFRQAVDNAKVAQLLTELGRSRLAANMNQIATRANAGIIETTPELVQELYYACETIRIMRDTLIMALGIKVRDGAA